MIKLVALWKEGRMMHSTHFRIYFLPEVSPPLSLSLPHSLPSHTETDMHEARDADPCQRIHMVSVHDKLKMVGKTQLANELRTNVS